MERPQPVHEMSEERENFKTQAEDIFLLIRRAVSEGKPKSEAYELARQGYIIEEDDPELRQLSQILLSAPDAYADSRKISELKALASPDLAEIRKLKTELITYNHKLRDFIYNNAEDLDEREMANWLERASGSNPVWAKSLLAGISAEVAAARSAGKLPGVAQVELSTAEEDAKGVDFKLHLEGGKKVMIDVKYGGQEPLGGVMSKGNVTEVGIGRGAVADFKMKKQYEGEFISKLRSIG